VLLRIRRAAVGVLTSRVSGGDRNALRSLAAGVLWAAPLFALWLALTDNTRPLEMLVGAVCALLAGAASESAGLLSHVRFRPRARWVVRAAAVPWWVVKDSALVLWALVAHVLARRPLNGRFVVVPFDAGGDAPRDVARRTMVYWAGSAGPNAYAIGGSDEAGVLVVHELVPTDQPLPVRLVEEP
jgi:multisubunit Na+/H+ antiporter MnhE subunit